MRWRPFRGWRHPDQTDAHAAARQRMVDEQIRSRGIADEELLSALNAVPRHVFLGPDERAEAYSDRAVGIGSGQTISQPYVVAAMTDAVRPPDGWRGARVLEIGTGSGYQSALLAELGADVTSIERHASLAEAARERLREAGYADRVRIVVGDGTNGLPDEAPFDAILVTAGGPGVPPPLIDQLSRDGGRLVMPVGTRAGQMLTVVERRGDDVTMRQIERVVFVPLIGAHGFGAED